MLQWAEFDLEDGLRVRLTASDTGLRCLEFSPDRPPEGEYNPDFPVLREAIRQLRSYCAGTLRAFDVPLDMQGTHFQLRVWRELLRIPFGQTRSYAQIAASIGAPSAVRAVGAANGANPIAIIVPCHRVIGSSGKLTGYGGGLPLKQRLLELEGCTTMMLR
jgi:methylated-DNA-[protein]-cysteine S-methyltransferase